MNETAGLHELLATHGIDVSSLQPFLGEPATQCWQMNTTGKKCVELWRKLRGIVDLTEHWPVILGDDDSLRLRESTAAMDNWPAFQQEMLEKGAQLEGQQWLRDQRDPRKQIEKLRAEADSMAKHGGESIAETYRKMALEMEKDLESKPVADRKLDPEFDWPQDPAAIEDFSVRYDLDRNFQTSLFIGLAPTRSCWEVPAYFLFGGFNECPLPEVHVAMLRHWHQAHFAELVTMTNDTIELEIGRRPQNRDEALRLANDQRWYAECPQLQHWYDKDFHHLAASLMVSSVWQFWWD